MEAECFVYRVCAEKSPGAIPLYESYGSAKKVCVYARKIPYLWSRADRARLDGDYVLKQTNTSGCGWSFGTAEESEFDPKAEGKEISLDPENLVLAEKNDQVEGYCVGEDSESGIFLPLDGGWRKTDYDYEYQVFPTDGTSSEYSCTTYTKLETRQKV